MDAAEIPSEGGRVKALQGWLNRRADSPVGRLVEQWFRAYFAASRNSASAATIYASLSALPMALVAVALFHLSTSDANAFADRLVLHLRLHGTTADLVHSTFASSSANLIAATVATVVGFLVWGLGIGQNFRDVYARAWGVKVENTAADQGRFAIFFFVLSAVLALALASASALRGLGWLILIVAWTAGSVAFWLWTPWFLLRRAVGLRRLLPGVLLAAFVIGGTVAFAPFYISPAMNENGSAFGSLGIVLTLLAYLFIIVTISMVCAVFAPVWAAWRSSERARGVS